MDNCCVVDPVAQSRLAGLTNEAYGLAVFAESISDRLADLVLGLEGETTPCEANPPYDTHMGLDGLNNAETRISSALNNISDGLNKLDELVKM